MALNIPLFRQGDPLWGYKKLGTSGLTMAEWGCYVSVLAAILVQLGYPDMTPGKLCDMINAANGFTPDGELDSRIIQDLFPRVMFRKRIITTANTVSGEAKMTIESAIIYIRKMLRYGHPVALHVDAIGHDGRADHFVEAIEELPSDFMIMDVATGTKFPFSQKYGDIKTGIKGIRSLSGSPMGYPDNATETDKDVGTVIGKASWANNPKAPKAERDLMVKEILESLT